MDATRLQGRDYEIYMAGVRGTRDSYFQFGEHLLYQDVFKAETPTHKVRISYDDVEGATYLTVTFKDRWRDRANRQVEMTYGSAKEAFARALVFLDKHSVPQPRCSVDY